MSEEQRLGRFVIQKQLGEGSFAWVYTGYDEELDRHVALKVLKPMWLADAQAVNRFKQEARTMARLIHPNIAVIYEVGEEAGQVFLAQFLVDGETLGSKLEREGPLSWAETLNILSQIASALDYAHKQGMIHRDIKPANILIDRKGEAFLGDFGLVRAAEGSASISASAGGMVGTPAYMAPEQWEAREVTPATDVYALSCVVFEMLTGRMLFNAATPASVMKQHLMEGPKFPESWPQDVPPQIVEILKRGLAENPADRISSAGALVTALEKASDGAVEPPPPPSPKEAVAEPVKPVETAPVAAPPPAKVAPAPAPAVAPAVPVAEAKGGGKGLIFAGGAVLLLILTAGGFFIFGGGGAEITTAGHQNGAAAVAAVEPTEAPAEAPPTDTPEPPTATPEPPTATPEPATPTSEPPTATSEPATATPEPEEPTEEPAAEEPSPTPTEAPTEAPPTPTPVRGFPIGIFQDFESSTPWRRGDEPHGEFTYSTAQVHSGSGSGQLAYNFPAVPNDYVVFQQQLPLLGEPTALSVWVYGDNSQDFLNAWIQDAQGEIWAMSFGQIQHEGWQQMTTQLDVNQEWPSGPISSSNNGQIDYPISFYALVLDNVPDNSGGQGTIYIDDLESQ